MLASNYPDAIIETPVHESIIRPKRPLPPHPGTSPGCPDMLHREKPANQAAFHEWVQAMSLRVYRLEHMIEGPMLPIDAPVVKD